MSVDEEEGYVTRVTTRYERVKIPEGHVKCPDCKGRGRIRWRYSEPSPFNDPSVSDYYDCPRCLGLGYLEKEVNEQIEEMHRRVEEALKKERGKSG